MKRKYLLRLIKACNNFDIESALKLSDEIHEAEARGYNISPLEDTLWAQLTFMIESCHSLKQA